MARKHRKLAILFKPEVTPGTDAFPTGAVNAMQVNDVTFTPMAGTEETRDLMLPYLGHQGVILTNSYAQIEFSVEIAGAKAAGTVPAFGALLRACGMAETITPGTDVVYSPISDGEEAGSLYYNEDGVRHVMLGCRGTVTLEFAPARIPRFRFTLMGLKGTITDEALPAAVYTGFATPLPVSKANTTISLLGYAACTETLTIDLGNQIEPRFLIGCESMEFVDRKTVGSTTVEAGLLATMDWFQKAQDHETGALALAHGAVAGNIVEIDAPAVQVGRVGTGQTQGITNYALPLMFTPVNGNDELTITVR